MRERRMPWFGWLGLGLVLLGQSLTLWHLRPLSDHWYGICWTGVTLLADGWVYKRSGRCLLRDRRADLGLLIVVSSAWWWGLEIANHTMQAWSYSESPDIPAWRQGLRSTFFFATLFPATWATGLAAFAWRPWNELRGDRRWTLPEPALAAVMLAGVACLVASFWLPRLALGLVLLGTLLLLDPLNQLRGRPSLLGHVANGEYRVPVVFGGATMAMGVVGEMWNYPASPKWTYDVPIIDFAYLFEMPLLGFAGYALLALTIFAIVHFVRSFVAPGDPSTGTDDPLALTGL
jgi:hypothetical protein